MRALKKVAGVALLVIQAVGPGLVAAPAHSAKAAGAPPAPPRVSSVQNSPGWYPVVDPESMSVVIGRRTNAPAVSKRFAGGATSLDDLGRRVCRALHRGDRDSLLALCIRDDEFRDILWREFPQSRPAVGLEWTDAWTILYARLHAGSAHAVRDWGGHPCEFVRFEPTRTVVPYRNFKLHDRLVLVARSDGGALVRMTWLRAVAERKGSFKIYSTDD
jgi:hypothetical protein